MQRRSFSREFKVEAVKLRDDHTRRLAIWPHWAG